MKILVVYESKYGNTKRVAEAIIEGIKQAKTVDVALATVKEINPNEVADYDVILVGSPNHIGGPTRGVKGFIDKLGKFNLEGKMFAVFDTYMGRNFEKAVKKMEEQINKKAPAMKRIAPGLSIRVHGLKGPIIEGELQKCTDFGKKIAEQLSL